MTASTTQPEKEGGGRKWLIALIILLLLFGIVGYGYVSGWFDEEADGSFQVEFQGCDSAGKCARFKLSAPGYAYRWILGDDVLEDIQGDPLIDVMSDDLKRAESVIAAGLASRENPRFPNRRLAACRSKALAGMIDDVQGELGSAAAVQRVVLGRYDAEDQADIDTGIERLLVVTYVLSSDDGVIIEEALKDGIRREVAPQLAALEAQIARQLDFAKYECWENDFVITPAGEARNACYPETLREFCDNFGS